MSEEGYDRESEGDGAGDPFVTGFPVRRSPRIVIMYVAENLSNQDVADILLADESLMVTDVVVSSPEDFGREIVERTFDGSPRASRLREFIDDNRNAIYVGMRYVHGKAGEREFDQFITDDDANR